MHSCFKTTCCNIPTAASFLLFLLEWLESLVAVSELARMYPFMVQWGPGQSHQTLYFDGCGHTDSHNHMYACPHPPASYLSYHTPFLTPKHTNTPPHQAGREEGSQYLRSRSYLASWSRYASNYRVFYNAALSLVSLNVPAGSNTSLHLLILLWLAQSLNSF